MPPTTVAAGLDRARRRIAHRLETALAALLGLLALLAAGQTLAWAVLGVASAAVEELMGVLLVTYGLLAAAWGVGRGVHLGLEIGRGRLPQRTRLIVDRLSGLAVATFGLLLAVAGARLAGSVVNVLPATGWSAAVEYVPASIAGALIAFFGLAETLLGRLADGVDGVDGSGNDSGDVGVSETPA